MAMFKRFLFTGLMMFAFAGFVLADGKSKAPTVDFSLQRVAFQIGDTIVHAQVRQFGKGDLTMVNLHDDEQASVEAGVKVLEKIGGQLIELTHSGKRRVVFSIDGKEFSFDPNRIFSAAGVRKTVTGEGKVPEEAYAAVDRFAKQFIDYFGLGKKHSFITLHNNGDGGLSIHTYEAGGEWALDTDELNISGSADPDEFFFVTEKKIYDELKQQDFNVVLQDNSIKRDDGSLSVFAGRHGIRYINVEAEPEHSVEQVRMLEAAVKAIGKH